MSDQNATRWALIYSLPIVLLALVLLIVFALLGVGIITAVIIAVVLALVVAAGLYFAAEPLTAKLVGAQPTGASLHPRLENVVEELCARTGVSEPNLFMVNSDVPDAVAFGTNASSSNLAVTNGLLNNLSLVELEGVLARELSRVKNGDFRFDTLGVAFVRLPFALFGGLGQKLIEWARGGDRDVQVDMAGVEITRYPPGLTSALATIKENAAATSSEAPGSPLTDHLWTRGMRRLATGPGEWSLDERIAVLQEL